jgi:uncharacterized membrane protein YkvA (DUF1232 family)/transcriptional regulator with XRE-family HTH domain
MLYSHLFKLMAQAQLSFEQLGERLGVSGMTLRRWHHDPPKGPLPKLYQTALVDATYQLIIDGALPHDSQVVKELLQTQPNLSIDAALKNLGLPGSHEKSAQQGNMVFLDALAKIGMDEGRRQQIEHGKSAIESFKKLGSDWKEKIHLLKRVISSSKLSLLEKVVAYGALFYLITPFDLVPDYVPVVGLIDDYGVLALAVGYYLKLNIKEFAGG